MGTIERPGIRELYRLEEEPTPMFGRGFTGHDHIVGFRLVNMNARLYDPMIGRMLSPDPIVQSPYFSQNHNRHSYCLNNPLAFTDPTGMKFTPDAQSTVEKYKDAIHHRVTDLLLQIEQLSDIIKIFELKTMINNYKTILSELEILSYSTQVYDISFNDGLNYGIFGSLSFDWNIGYVIINISAKDKNNIAAIAHEFKHAYQFEVGELSAGPELSNQEFPYLLYDRIDEYDAYERQDLFGVSKSIFEIDLEYYKLPLKKIS